MYKWSTIHWLCVNCLKLDTIFRCYWFIIWDYVLYLLIDFRIHALLLIDISICFFSKMPNNLHYSFQESKLFICQCHGVGTKGSLFVIPWILKFQFLYYKFQFYTMHWEKKTYFVLHFWIIFFKTNSVSLLEIQFYTIHWERKTYIVLRFWITEILVSYNKYFANAMGSGQGDLILSYHGF